MRFIVVGLLLSSLANAADLDFSNGHLVDGDSIGAGTTCAPSDTSSNQWNQCKLRLDAAGVGFNLTNLCDPGDMVGDLTAGGEITNELASARWNVYSNVWVYLTVGLNNIAVGDTVQSLTNSYAIVVANCKAVRPGVRVIPCTILNTASAGWDTTRSNRVNDFNAFIRSDGFGTGYFLDAVNDSRMSDGNDSTFFCSDKTHPTAAGYTVLADHTMEYLTTNRVVGDRLFVRKDGSDSAKGTTNSAAGAFLTIQKAATTASAGDVIYVQPGFFPEQVTVLSNASAQFPIVISGGAAVTNGGFVLNGSNVIVMNFALTGTNVPGNDRVMQSLGSWQTFSNLSFYGITNIGNYPSGAIMGSSSKSNRWEKLFVSNSGEHYYVVIGQGHIITNIVATGETGWDMIRPFCRDTLFTSIIGTNLTNPHGNPSAHPDFVQAFGDNGDMAVDNVFDGVYLHTLGDDYQLGNITDDQETNGIARFTFKNLVAYDVARTMNLYAPDFSFYHCTFINCATNSSDVITHGSSGAGHANGLNVVNCIFYHCGERISGLLGDTASRGWYDGDAITGGTRNYNLVVGQGSGTTKTGFSEANGINGSDPFFANISSDWRLQSGSPAIDAGTNLLSLVATDILRASRDSTPSLGAYEAAGESVTATITSRTGTGRATKGRSR